MGAETHVYATTRGAIQGCPLGMLMFCVSYAKSAGWMEQTLQAAGAGSSVLPEYRDAPPPHLRRLVCVRDREEVGTYEVDPMVYIVNLCHWRLEGRAVWWS